MSDRIAVMSQGRVEQVGPPQEIYEEPRTAYVADFLGVSNLMEGDGARGREPAAAASRSATFELIAGEGEARHARRVEDHDPARARRSASDRAPPGENRVPGMVERVVYVGLDPAGVGHARARASASRRGSRTRAATVPFAVGDAGGGAPAARGTARPARRGDPGLEDAELERRRAG